jgi:hypothetical protein
MKKVLVILAALTSLWIPDYLWAMAPDHDTNPLYFTHQVCMSMNIGTRVSESV